MFDRERSRDVYAVQPIDRQPPADARSHDNIIEVYPDGGISSTGSTEHCVLSTYHEHKSTVWHSAATRRTLSSDTTSCLSWQTTALSLTRLCVSNVLCYSYIATCASRYIVHQISRRYITAQTACREYSSNVLFIPWIPQSPTDAGLPFTLRRPQFARTTNKANFKRCSARECCWMTRATVCRVIADW